MWSSGQSSWLQNGDVLCFLWGTNWIYKCYVGESRLPLWSSGQRFEFDSWQRIRPYGIRHVTTWHPLAAKIGTNFADKRRSSFGRYSSFPDSGHGYSYSLAPWLPRWLPRALPDLHAMNGMNGILPFRFPWYWFSFKGTAVGHFTWLRQVLAIPPSVRPPSPHLKASCMGIRTCAYSMGSSAASLHEALSRNGI
jgi:hypothetical protein